MSEEEKREKSHIAYTQSLRSTIEMREKDYPMLKICKKCASECKKHGAKDLAFECFDFVLIK